jgi:hypothetical protein
VFDFARPNLSAIDIDTINTDKLARDKFLWWLHADADTDNRVSFIFRYDAQHRPAA